MCANTIADSETFKRYGDFDTSELVGDQIEMVA